MMLFSFTPPRLRIPYSKAIVLAAALAPLMASARPDKFTCCHQEKRYQDPYARAECLRESRDARAIPELYAMAREIVTEAQKQGIKNFANMPDEFGEQAERAGEVAAWSDGAFLAERSRSADVYDQAFAVRAFTQGLLDIHSSSEVLNKRIKRFRKLREYAQPACQNLVNSPNAHVQARAQECVSDASAEPQPRIRESKESMKQIVERARRETGMDQPQGTPMGGLTRPPASSSK